MATAVARAARSLPGSQFFTMPFRRHSKQSYELNPPDQVYNVIYLGNVLTIMGKGDASVDKPLNVIWKTFNAKKQSREINMKLSVTRSGLKAETKQLGLTEYWSHLVTYCVAPVEYPRIFCWVYKHEGKRMKPELRCHAVLCKKASEPFHISANLNRFLQAALQEYKREKLAMEKARKNSLTGQGPRRKILLQTGSLNFRPPISRSKSAPRLGSIDEEDEVEEEPFGNEEDFLDAESLCYRNNPLLEGSTVEDMQRTPWDTSSLASSSAQSSCSVPSSLASSISSSLATTILPIVTLASAEEVECGEEEENLHQEYCNSSPTSLSFQRQLSMSRQSQNKLHKQICVNMARSKTRANKIKHEVDTDSKKQEELIANFSDKLAYNAVNPVLSDDEIACCLSSTTPSTSNPNLHNKSHLECCKQRKQNCSCQSTYSSAAKRRLFCVANPKASFSSVGSDGSDSQLSDESGYVDEFSAAGKNACLSMVEMVLQPQKCGVYEESTPI